jgi:cytochrome c-type biogenesis protein CcmH
VGSGRASSVAPVESLIAGLAARLENEPDDAKGWALLSQSYAFLGDTAHAESALAKAVALGLDEAELRQRVAMARSAVTNIASTTPISGPVIHGTVAVENGVDLDLPAEARLLITAKATDGSPMPIAVLGTELPAFPYAFTLSDAQAMVPGVALGSYEELSISARISHSGTASRAPNDLESDTRIVRLDSAEPIEIFIPAN